MSFSRWTRRRVPNLVPIGPAYDSFPRLLNLWHLTHPPTRHDPGVLRGALYLAYAHSQMNPQTWTKVGANRSNRLTASPDFLMFDPLNAPLCLLGQFVWRISIPRWICTCVPNLVPIGPAVSHLPLTFAFVTPNPPPQMSRGKLYLAYVHSQTNLQTCTKFGANRSSRLIASPDFLICDPLKPPEIPLCVLRFNLFVAYIHSQINLQMCAKFGVNRSSRLVAFPEFMVS